MTKRVAAAPSWGEHIVGLEGLRGLAALFVVVYHVGHVMTPMVELRAQPEFQALDSGLTLFFVLSGFLLFWPFASRLMEEREHPPLRKYFFNRAIRIWPAYLIILAIASFVVRSAVLPTGLVGRLSVKNFLLDATLLQTFTTTWQRTGLEVAWTLTAEVSFYAILPLMVLATERLFPRARRIQRASIPVAFMIVLGFVMRTVLFVLNNHHFHDPNPWLKDSYDVLNRTVLANADLFGIGMLAALVFIGFRRGAFSLRQAALARGIVVALGFVAWVSFFVSGPGYPFQSTEAAVGFVAILLLVVLPNSHGSFSRWSRFFDWLPLRYVGVVSFSLYLWHLVVIRFMIAHHLVPGGGGRLGFVVDLVVVTVVSLSLATITYYGIERPALKLKRRNKPIAADVPALVGTPSSAPTSAESHLV